MNFKHAPIFAVAILALIVLGGYLQPKACEEGKTRDCITGLCDGTQTCVKDKWGACVKDDPGCIPIAPECGNYKCEIFESCDNCPEDCGDCSETHPFGFTGFTGKMTELIKFKELGEKYSRKRVDWDTFETSDNVTNFNSLGRDYDISLDDLYNIPILRLETGQGWGTSCDPDFECHPHPTYTTCPSSAASCPPKDLGEWGEQGYSPLLYDFVTKLFEYMYDVDGKVGAVRPIEYIIVGNEVNTWIFWHGTTEEYLKIRATVYKAVKDFNSKYGKSVKVADNGIAGGVWQIAMIADAYCAGEEEYAVDFYNRFFRRDDRRGVPITLTDVEQYIESNELDCGNLFETKSILKKMFEIDPNLGEPSYDYMSYHFYGPWDTQEETINWIKEEMQKNGYQRGIVHTEGGYEDSKRSARSHEDPNIAADVANDVVKLHVVAFANGVKMWIWLPPTERAEDSKEMGSLKGLLRLPDFSELPAFTSYKTMKEKLDGFTSVQRLVIGEYSYKFTVKNDPVYVLWSAEPQTVDLSSEISGNVLITGIDGGMQTVPSSSISVSESPIFVESV